MPLLVARRGTTVVTKSLQEFGHAKPLVRARIQVHERQPAHATGTLCDSVQQQAERRVLPRGAGTARSLRNAEAGRAVRRVLRRGGGQPGEQQCAGCGAHGLACCVRFADGFLAPN
jgi:hypothetical protein